MEHKSDDPLLVLLTDLRAKLESVNAELTTLKTLSRMHRVQRVTLDITINAGSCEVESVELKRVENIRNITLEELP